MRIGYEGNGVSAEQGFEGLLIDLLGKQQDASVAPRGMTTWETLNASVKYDFRRYSPFCTRYKEPNVRRYFAGELKWYLSGSPYLADIVDFSSFQKKATNDGVYLNSAYGARLYGKHPNRPSQLGFDQLMYCARLLKDDPDTRRAIAVILTPEDLREDDDLGFDSNDVPCTVSVHWMIRDGELHQIVDMRSNDIMRGFVYDVPAMAFIHALMLHTVNKLNGQPVGESRLKLGPYYHNMHSIHLYDRWLDKAKAVFNEPVHQGLYAPFERMDFLHGMDSFIAGEESKGYNEPWRSMGDWIAQEKETWQ